MKKITISIDKKIKKDFKTIVEKELNVKYLQYLKDVLLYGKVPNFKNIFNFYGVDFNKKYSHIKSNDSLQIEFNKEYLQIIEIFNKKNNDNTYTLSAYIREFIILFTHEFTLFNETFEYSLNMEYDGTEDFSTYLKLIPQELMTLHEHNEHLMLDIDILREKREKTRELLVKEMLVMTYSDFCFQDQYSKNKLKFDDLTLSQQEVSVINRCEYKMNNRIKILLLDIKLVKLILIYIYKNLYLNTKRIDNESKKYQEILFEYYEEYIKTINQNIEFNYFISMILHNNNELLRLSLSREVKLENLSENFQNFIPSHEKHKIRLCGSPKNGYKDKLQDNEMNLKTSKTTKPLFHRLLKAIYKS